MAAVASSSSGSSGGVAVLDGVPTPAAFLPPVAAVPPLQQSRQQPGAGRQQRGSLNGAVPAPKQQPGGRRPASQRYAAPADARSIDYQITEAHVIVGAYDALCEDSDLDEALHLVKECIRAGRADVLAK